jgi:hypothetical protein
MARMDRERGLADAAHSGDGRHAHRPGRAVRRRQNLEERIQLSPAAGEVRQVRWQLPRDDLGGISADGASLRRPPSGTSQIVDLGGVEP